MGASCTCNAAAAGSIPVLSTSMAVTVTAVRHARLVCERARCNSEWRLDSTIITQASSNGRTLAFGSSNRGSNPRA